MLNKIKEGEYIYIVSIENGRSRWLKPEPKEHNTPYGRYTGDARACTARFMNAGGFGGSPRAILAAFVSPSRGADQTTVKVVATNMRTKVSLIIART